MAVYNPYNSTQQVAKIFPFLLPLNSTAGTYDICTAQGDVFVEVLSVYTRVAGAGFTTFAMQTDHPTPKTVLAATAVASVTLDSDLTIVTSKFVLPDGKRIRGQLVGNGSAGQMILVLRVSPITQGATIS